MAAEVEGQHPTLLVFLALVGMVLLALWLWSCTHDD
jgi:hypothetical protein